MELTFCEGARSRQRIPEWLFFGIIVVRCSSARSIRNEIVSRLFTAEAVAATIARKMFTHFYVYIYIYIYTYIYVCTSSRIIGTPSMDEIGIMLFKQPTPVRGAMQLGDKIENASSRFYDCEEPRAIERARDRVTIRAPDNTLQITRYRPPASECG